MTDNIVFTEGQKKVLREAQRRMLNDDVLLTPSERRTLLRLLDLEWGRVNRERDNMGVHLRDTALVYLQDLESLQRKLTA